MSKKKEEREIWLPDKSSFKGGNTIKTNSLFYETAQEALRSEAYYTFKPDDHVVDTTVPELIGKKFVSIHRLYIEMADPGEWEFATTYFLSFDQWTRICNNNMCRPYIDKMRFELSMKLRSQAIKEIIGQATTAKGFQAAKYIAEKGWETEKTKATKEKKQEEEKEMWPDLAEDIKRAGIEIQ